ncbi:MAG: mechanosensitive ion channel family protein [Gammaproteobacteria bacterium]
MEAWIRQLQELSSQWGRVPEVFAVVLGTLAASFVARRVLNRLGRETGRTRTVADDALVAALSHSVRLLIWVVGLAFAAEVAFYNADSALAEMIDPARTVGVVLALALFATRFVGEYHDRWVADRKSAGKAVDETAADAVAKLLRAAIVITAVLVALQSLGFSVSGILAFGGIGGIAVGLAAKDLLANMFGGLTVYLDRPFSVGDWIRSPDKEIEGVVERIGWRTTCIRTFSKRPLYVPNAAFTTIAVENPSRMTHRRIYETIGVRYDDMARLPGILDDIRTYLGDSDDIDQGQALMVNLNQFGPSSADFFIYAMTHTTVWAEYHQVKEKVLLRISEIIESHGGEIAFPTTTVHMPEGLALVRAGEGA